MAKWRKENDVDTILERASFPEQDAVLDAYPMCVPQPLSMP